MSIDVNVQNDLVIVTESSEDITVNVSNAAGPAGVGVPSGGSTGQVLKKFSGTNYDTYWAADGGGVPYSGATGDVNLGEFQLRAGQLTLDTSPTGTAAVGTTRWNDTIGSSETTLKGGSVILKNGVDLVARVVNKVSPNTTLTKAAYQAVRVSGAQGQRLAVAFAQANNDANSADTIGLVTETIATNQEGFIMTVGQLENINTTGSLQGETWADGDVLYLSPTTAGSITKVKPTGNGHIVVIGYVEYAHQNNGKIYVKVMNGWELTELHDCDIITPANNEALIYESSTSLWKNKTIASALGYTPISGTGATGQVAYWNGTNSQTGSNNLFWDAANARLGIGTNTFYTPTGAWWGGSSQEQKIFLKSTGISKFTSLVISGGQSGFGGGAIQFINDAGTSVADFGTADGTEIGFAARQNTANINFYTTPSGTTPTKRLSIFSSGNVAIQAGGTFSDGGQRLQVYGDAFIKGSGNTSATNGLVVQNSGSNALLTIRNNGWVQFGGTSGVLLFPFSTTTGGTVDLGGQNLHFYSYTSSGASSGRYYYGGNSITATSANNINMNLGGGFTPSSGTAIYTELSIISGINQTGGANGITRGLYVNPTLTAAADWRSIEWSNNSGWGLYGAGTAPNFLGGNTTINLNQNAQTYLELKNTTSNTNSSASLQLTSSQGFGGASYNKYSATTTAYKIVQANDLGIYNTYAGDIALLNDFGTGKIKFAAGSASTAQLTLTAAGRLLLGTTTEGTFMLDVNGTARVSGNLRQTNGNNYIDIVSNANGSQPYIDFFFSGTQATRLNSYVAMGGSFINGNGIMFGSGTSTTTSLDQKTLGLLATGIIEAKLSIVLSGTGENKIQFFQPGVAYRGNIGVASGTSYIQVRTGQATNLTDGTLSQVWFESGNVSVGTTTTEIASAILSASSTTKGFLPPRMTTTQKNAISTPAAGLQVYDTTLNQMSYYNGTTWVNF